MRSAHNFKAEAQALTACRNCHEPVPPHTVCKNCGFYKGSKRIETAKDKKKAEK
jgi:large subunit ribosomal protein L32